MCHQWFIEAIEMNKRMYELFYDEDGGGYSSKDDAPEYALKFLHRILERKEE